MTLLTIPTTVIVTCSDCISNEARPTLSSGFANEELECEPAVDGRVGEPLERRRPRQTQFAAEQHRHGALGGVGGQGDVVQPEEPSAQVRPQVEQEFADRP